MEKIEFRTANEKDCGLVLSFILGAKPMNDWTVYRIAGDTLKDLAK